MCLIGFAQQAFPDYLLVLGANRDEFHERPTAPAGFWQDDPSILAGRDKLGAGTWLGLGTDGRVAAVTNFREARPRDPDKRSRGELVSAFLKGGEPAKDYAHRISGVGDQYSGFSLLLFDRDQGWFVSNRDGRPSRIEPGVHALSNHLLDTPWPKVQRLRKSLEGQLEAGHFRSESLWNALLDERYATRSELPDTGLGAELERELSPPFVVSPEYGTRSSTIVTVAANGRAHFAERTFDRFGRERFARRYDFTLGRIRLAPAEIDFSVDLEW